MVQTLSVNENNDLYLGQDGSIVIATGLTAVMQNCEQAVKTILGEMILHTDEGVPNFELIWNGVPNVIQYEAALRSAISDVAGVTEIVSLTISMTDNTLSYSAVIRTDFGQGVING